MYVDCWIAVVCWVSGSHSVMDGDFQAVGCWEYVRLSHVSVGTWSWRWVSPCCNLGNWVFQFVLEVKSGSISAIFVTLSIGINSKWSKKCCVSVSGRIEKVGAKDCVQFRSESTRESIRVYREQ